LSLSGKLMARTKFNCRKMRKISKQMSLSSFFCVVLRTWKIFCYLSCSKSNTKKSS